MVIVQSWHFEVRIKLHPANYLIDGYTNKSDNTTLRIASPLFGILFLTDDKTWKEIAQIKAEPGESKGPLL